ncbi:MAG: Gfo/Idh/MocA family oxidoreductase [Saprospiraceae bacterium]|nr:Gfo/Idh/MocA family oxidoreductase [Saprospiraceae bacterium]
MKTFALIGAAGYIAPRHMRAIKETGHQLVAALDMHDSVGVIDTYFPEAAFFTEFERFDRHLEKLKRSGRKVDYISICSPNYLHDAHIRFGLRYGAHVICEKPLVLNPWNIDVLRSVEKESGCMVQNILQLRLHPNILALKKSIEAASEDDVFDIDLTYITARGRWYFASWKGDESQSGGIATNIGIHFFDVLIWIFGPVLRSRVHVHTHDRASGFLELKRARVRWFLSINGAHIPSESVGDSMTYRVIKIGDKEIDLDRGFDNLHVSSYQQILIGQGYGLEKTQAAIQLVHDIRNATPETSTGSIHPLADLPLTDHPFKRDK